MFLRKQARQISYYSLRLVYSIQNELIFDWPTGFSDPCFPTNFPLSKAPSALNTLHGDDLSPLQILLIITSSLVFLSDMEFDPSKKSPTCFDGLSKPATPAESNILGALVINLVLDPIGGNN